MIEKLSKTNNEDMPWIDEDGCYWKSKSSYLQTEILGFCGCGNPGEIMEYVKEMLEILDSQNWGSYENKPYMFFVYWANNKGFADHGTTARCSWLTEKGKEILRDIKLCM
ncbi:MAG: hypothetical protein ABIK92_21870 [Pseudomonadota bacterium]